jgi:hypothetical protein
MSRLTVAVAACARDCSAMCIAASARQTVGMNGTECHSTRQLATSRNRATVASRRHAHNHGHVVSPRSWSRRLATVMVTSSRHGHGHVISPRSWSRRLATVMVTVTVMVTSSRHGHGHGQGQGHGHGHGHGQGHVASPRSLTSRLRSWCFFRRRISA